ncbi:MAG TPA: hypothetical protein VFS25_13180 [Chitinophaga sp.]|uniref:hypothetical protein n=1 Tax=Chitinophaga sp. TaxID=1869181 RepID=UPI002DBB1D6E|nr:hypothetical protein [Chitinophaga sp.]HEU4553787.1 hypothetical protein [Chitinophaga sp.]
MTEPQLTSLLEGITGHLTAATPEQEKALQQARQRIAASLLHSDDTGSEQLFVNSDLYSRDKISAASLDNIAAVAKQASRQQTDDGLRVYIRSVPVRSAQLAGSVPEWAAGAKAVETIGPFLNNEGREIWVDVYRVVKLITLYMGTQPVLLFTASVGRIVPIGAPAGNYTLAAGSMWINARLLSPTAPVDRFVGVKIKGGTLKLSLAPTVQNNKITLNPNTSIDFALQLVQDADDGAAGTSACGSDARAAKYQLPETWDFTWSGTTKRIATMTIGNATCELYGQPFTFAYQPVPNPALIYNDTFHQVLVPWMADAPQLTVTSSKSPFVTFSGTAAVLNSYWSLPAAVLDVSHPLEAEGNGGLLLQCDAGLRAVWTNLHDEEVRLTQPVIAGAPGAIVIIDLLSNISGASEHLDLWKDAQHPRRCSVDLVFADGAPFFYSSSSPQGQEFVSTVCNSDFKTDRPVKVNGEVFDIRSRSSLLMMAASDTRRLVYLYDDNIIADNQPVNVTAVPAVKPVAIALENAVFTVSPVNACLLFGECNEAWTQVTRANFFLSFVLYRYLPTLPDPYVGNLRTWERLFGRENGTRSNLAAIPISMLLCAVKYSPVDDATDDVNTGFHFGALPPGDVTTLPGAAAPPAPAANTGAAALTRNAALTRSALLTANATRAAVVPRALAAFGAVGTAVKINTASLEKTTAENNAFLEKLTLRPDFTVTLPNQPQPALDTTLDGQALQGQIAEANKGYGYTNLWDNAIVGSRLNAEPFALLDVSSNANQLGISVSGQMIIVKTGTVVPGGPNIAGGAAVNEAAVVTAATGFPFIVEGMQVKTPGTLVRSFALPQFAWEPVINLTPPDREDPLDNTSPKLPMDPEAGFIYFPDDGGPTRTWNNNTKPVALAPVPVVTSLLDEFKSNPQNFTVSAFTLPFGLKGISYISKHFVEPQKPDMANVRPLFRKQEDGTYKLQGGIQLRMIAGAFGKTDPEMGNDSPMFPGYVVQLNNLLSITGQPTLASNLGHRVTEIFNNEFLTGVLSLSNLVKDSRGVPVSRMDITGYGASMFSNWLSPSAAMAQTSQAKFDVMLGRTAHEVIQVRSILYPWGIRVVRTITLFRTGTGYVYRTDSGWKAESDGKFDFSYRYKKKGVDPYTTNPADFVTEHEPYEFHPGIIKGLFNVRNIKDAPSVVEYTDTNDIPNNTDYLNGIKGQIYTNTSGNTLHEPVKCGGVYFDADVEIENVVQGHIEKRVVSKKILGYVQVAPAGKPLTVAQLKALLALQSNSIGGDLDCVVDINSSDQQMRLNRFDVSSSVDAGGNTVFVVAARGNVFLPKDGSWAMVQHNAGSGEVTALPTGVTVPLIRTGKWKKDVVIDPAVVTSQLLRIAHPLEILRPPAANTINFGYLQSTATQKALFLTPAYGKAQKMLLSKTPPIFADAYRLMTGNGIFPNIGNAIDNFGKAMPMLNGIDSAGNNAVAFVTNALQDGGTQVLELLAVEAEKAGEAVVKQGMNLLQKGLNGAIDKAMNFDIPPFDIPLVNTEGLRIYIHYATEKKKTHPQPDSAYGDGKLNFDVDSFAGDMANQWKSRVNNLSMIVDLGDMKKLITIKGNFDAAKNKESGYEGGNDIGLPVPEIEFSDALQPVIDILEVLAQLSQGNYAEAMKRGLKIAMSNSGEIWEYKFEATKEIPLVRFPPTDELYNSAQTPLKLEASLGVGVYFNAALKVTTDPGQLLPTAGAFLQFHGGISVMCMSVGVGSIFAQGSVDVKIACDTKVGPNLTLAFAFGVQIVVSLPVVGHASVTFMVGIEMYADKDKVVITAMMLFRGNAELLGGLVCVTISIEAKGIVEKSGSKTETSAQVTFALDISIFLIIDISFSKTWGEDRQIA